MVPNNFFRGCHSAKCVITGGIPDPHAHTFFAIRRNMGLDKMDDIDNLHDVDDVYQYEIVGGKDVGGTNADL